MQDNRNFMEYMSEKQPTDRWTILMAGLMGGFAGAILMLMVAFLGLI